MYKRCFEYYKFRIETQNPKYRYLKKSVEKLREINSKLKKLKREIFRNRNKRFKGLICSTNQLIIKYIKKTEKELLCFDVPIQITYDDIIKSASQPERLNKLMFHSTLKDIFLNTNVKSYKKAKACKYTQKICKMMKEKVNDMKIINIILSEYVSTDEEDQEISHVCII